MRARPSGILFTTTLIQRFQDDADCGVLFITIFKMDHGYKSGCWSLWYRGSVITDTEVLFFFLATDASHTQKWHTWSVEWTSRTGINTARSHYHCMIMRGVMGKWRRHPAALLLLVKDKSRVNPHHRDPCGQLNHSEDLWPLVWNKWPPFAPKADLIEYAEEYLSVLFAESTINITVV